MTTGTLPPEFSAAIDRISAEMKKSLSTYIGIAGEPLKSHRVAEVVRATLAGAVDKYNADNGTKATARVVDIKEIEDDVHSGFTITVAGPREVFEAMGMAGASGDIQVRVAVDPEAGTAALCECE